MSESIELIGQSEKACIRREASQLQYNVTRTSIHTPRLDAVGVGVITSSITYFSWRLQEDKHKLLDGSKDICSPWCRVL
jgi:hypothetical protein